MQKHSFPIGVQGVPDTETNVEKYVKYALLLKLMSNENPATRGNIFQAGVRSLDGLINMYMPSNVRTIHIPPHVNLLGRTQSKPTHFGVDPHALLSNVITYSIERCIEDIQWEFVSMLPGQCRYYLEGIYAVDALSTNPSTLLNAFLTTIYTTPRSYFIRKVKVAESAIFRNFFVYIIPDDEAHAAFCFYQIGKQWYAVRSKDNQPFIFCSTTGYQNAQFQEVSPENALTRIAVMLERTKPSEASFTGLEEPLNGGPLSDDEFVTKIRAALPDLPAFN